MFRDEDRISFQDIFEESSLREDDIGSNFYTMSNCEKSMFRRRHDKFK